MLTVKLIEHNGHEQIHEVKQVWAEPAEDKIYMNVFATPATEGEPLRFSNYGAVYVMNEAGRTVGSYFLGYGEGQGAAAAGERNIAAPLPVV